MFITFKKYTDPQEAARDTALLEQHGIKTIVSAPTQALLSDTLIGSQYNDGTLLKISDTDFLTARQLLIDNTSAGINEVQDNYMLLSLTDDELKEVLAKPEEWGAYNYNLAREILAGRGIAVDEQEIHQKQQEHVKQLMTQKTTGSFWPAAAGILLLLNAVQLLLEMQSGRVFLFSSLGTAAWSLAILQTATTLPDGKRIYAYDRNSRRSARIILYASIAVLLGTLLMAFRTSYSML